MDASQIGIADEGLLTIDVSDEASVQMSDTPSAGAQQRGSLWQSRLVSYRLTCFRNWPRRRDEAAPGFGDDIPCRDAAVRETQGIRAWLTYAAVLRCGED